MNKLYTAVDAAIKFLVSTLILAPMMFSNIGLMTYADWSNDMIITFDKFGICVLLVILALTGYIAWNVARMISYNFNPKEYGVF